MRVNPVVERYILKTLKLFPKVLIESTKEYNPFDVDVLTVIDDGFKDFFGSLTPTGHQNMTFCGFPISKFFWRKMKIRVNNLSYKGTF